MFEIRIFEARVPEDRPPETIARLLPDLDTFDLDLAIMALEAKPEEKRDLLGIAGVHKGRVISAPRIVVNGGEDARIESGAHLEDPSTRPTLAADVRWEPLEGGLFLLKTKVDYRGEVLEGETRARADESFLLARSENGSLLAAVFTIRPLKAKEDAAP
jgi:hypothetical protein